ncbi:MAG: hypothetical protein GF381_00835 [Candidatus Pacebacteria bacterium]|nr:hypothetical protein [Candidatus Paceibacterota bacterium]
MKKRFYFILSFLIVVLAFGLRTIKLNQVPPGLYWEEVALGYDAYSILKTGKDHHANSWPVVAFESFGDWKPSLYFYSAVPSIALLGLNLWGVRLPAIVSGVVIVIGVGQLSGLVYQQITQKNMGGKLVKLAAMLITAISPWAIQFSRAAWETNLATALILWGLIFGLRFKQQKKLSELFLAGLLLSLAVYAYHAARITAPLVGLSLLVSNWRQIKSLGWKKVGLIGLVVVLLLFPFVRQLGSQQLSKRAAQTTIFSQLQIIEQSNAMKQAAGNSLLSRLIYHRYLLFGREIMINFIDHFNFDFLFISGDANPRHGTQYFGQLFHLELIGLIFGLVYLVKSRAKINWLLGFWLVASILPAALTRTTPHALRTLSALPLFLMTITFGWVYIWQLLNNIGWQKLFLTSLVGLYLVELIVFWNFYFSVYPRLYADHWQAGYGPAIGQLKLLQEKYPDYPVYVTRSQGRPAMYYWFYNQINPSLVQAQAENVKKDQGEFLEFGQIKFGHGLEQQCQEHCLVLMTQAEFENNKLGLKKIDTQFKWADTWQLGVK